MLYGALEALISSLLPLLECVTHLIVVLWTSCVIAYKPLVNSDLSSLPFLFSSLASLRINLLESPVVFPCAALWLVCCSLPCWVPRCSGPSEIFLQTHHFPQPPFSVRPFFPSAILESPTPVRIYSSKTRPSQAPPGSWSLGLAFHFMAQVHQLPGRQMCVSFHSQFLSPCCYHYVQYRRKFLCSDEGQLPFPSSTGYLQTTLAVLVSWKLQHR